MSNETIKFGTRIKTGSGIWEVREISVVMNGNDWKNPYVFLRLQNEETKELHSEPMELITAALEMDAAAIL